MQYLLLGVLGFIILIAALALAIQQSEKRLKKSKRERRHAQLRIILDDHREFSGNFVTATFAAAGRDIDFHEVVGINDRGRHTEIELRGGGLITHLQEELDGTVSINVPGVSLPIDLSFRRIRKLSRGSFALRVWKPNPCFDLDEELIGRDSGRWAVGKQITG